MESDLQALEKLNRDYIDSVQRSDARRFGESWLTVAAHVTRG